MTDDAPVGLFSGRVFSPCSAGIASAGLAERLITASVDMDANIREQTRPLVVESSDPGE